MSRKEKSFTCIERSLLVDQTLAVSTPSTARDQPHFRSRFVRFSSSTFKLVYLRFEVVWCPTLRPDTLHLLSRTVRVHSSSAHALQSCDKLRCHRDGCMCALIACVCGARNLQPRVHALSRVSSGRGDTAHVTGPSYKDVQSLDGRIVGTSVRSVHVVACEAVRRLFLHQFSVPRPGLHPSD